MTSNKDEEEKSPYARTPADVLKQAGYEKEAEAIENDLNQRKASVLEKHRHKNTRRA